MADYPCGDIVLHAEVPPPAASTRVILQAPRGGEITVLPRNNLDEPGLEQRLSCWNPERLAARSVTLSSLICWMKAR